MHEYFTRVKGSSLNNDVTFLCIKLKKIIVCCSKTVISLLEECNNRCQNHTDRQVLITVHKREKVSQNYLKW